MFENRTEEEKVIPSDHKSEAEVHSVPSGNNSIVCWWNPDTGVVAHPGPGGPKAHIKKMHQPCVETSKVPGEPWQPLIPESAHRSHLEELASEFEARADTAEAVCRDQTLSKMQRDHGASQEDAFREAASLLRNQSDRESDTGGLTDSYEDGVARKIQEMRAAESDCTGFSTDEALDTCDDPDCPVHTEKGDGRTERCPTCGSDDPAKINSTSELPDLPEDDPDWTPCRNSFHSLGDGQTDAKEVLEGLFYMGINGVICDPIHPCNICKPLWEKARIIIES